MAKRKHERWQSPDELQAALVEAHRVLGLDGVTSGPKPHTAHGPMGRTEGKRSR
jgi:hypothetical protein